MVVASQVKAFIKTNFPDMNVGGDVADKLVVCVERLLMDAVERAKEAGRKTLKARDL